MIKSNFHTHTTFADGAHTVEQNAVRAIEKGFHTLGFSEHCVPKVDVLYGMDADKPKDYIREVIRVREKYRNEINILLGSEHDLYGEPIPDLDYVIGSVHVINANGTYYALDESEAEFEKVISSFKTKSEFFECYFSEFVKLAKTVTPTIIGHFDLITKYNRANKFFDEQGKEFLDIATDAILQIKNYCSLFELNTGAVTRGYKDLPYPGPEILKFMQKNGVDIIVSSDSHSVDKLDGGFDMAEILLKECGFTHRVELSGSKQIKVAL